MSQKECVRVQEAIDVLYEARSELLRPHWTEILAFVRKLELHLITHGNALPPTASNHGQVRAPPGHCQPFMTLPHSNDSSASASTCEDRPGFVGADHILPQPPQ